MTIAEWSRLCWCFWYFIICPTIKSLRKYRISPSALPSLSSFPSLQLSDTLVGVEPRFRHINWGLRSLLHLPFQEAALTSHLAVLFTSSFATFPFCSLIFVRRSVMMPYDILSLNWYSLRYLLRPVMLWVFALPAQTPTHSVVIFICDWMRAVRRMSQEYV